MSPTLNAPVSSEVEVSSLELTLRALRPLLEDADMTEIRIAAPNRCQKWVSTNPGNPERPNSSVPGEAS